ncbi:GNAT family N-acetyltransferase [Nocardioides sp. CFH 31398]|uniref:GNAT family N-acetyltransferase n=1 Tax=Nocardioides sp. CFH 31398 TaxID=2919579 RepID=UPI001F0519B6|nr:GNAT family protein [Nocardioides sp. CFH 31398]MCH1866949.1 GNAT family N-acetyltransferase [Nocardioides sp. CFH 31398]
MSSAHHGPSSASAAGRRGPSALLPPFAALELGPIPVAGGLLVLRPPLYSDHAQWREVRLRNERAIKRFWPSSELTWAEQHTEWRWAREVNDLRHEAAAGSGLSFVVEVDGRFAGQVTLTGIDPGARTAEVGVWVDRAVARRDVAATAVCAIVDHAFDHLGLDVVTAPVSTANVPAAVTAEHVGFTPEATMRGYSHISGGWGDHRLLSLHADDRPRGGLLARRPATRSEGAADRVPRRSRRVDHLPSSPGCRVALAKYAASRLKHGLRRLGRRGPAVDGSSLSVVAEGRAVRCGVRHLDAGHSAAEVYVDDPASVEEAVAGVRHAVEHGTRVLGLHRLTALAAPEDDLLATAYAEAGLRHEGTLRSRLGEDGTRRDVELWARLDDDPVVEVTITP